MALTFLRCGFTRRDHIRATPRGDVKGTIDMLGDGGNLRPELLFDAVKVKTILVRDQVDGETQMTESAGTTDTVKVSFRVLGEIEVDDDIDRLNIDTAGE